MKLLKLVFVALAVLASKLAHGEIYFQIDGRYYPSIALAEAFYVTGPFAMAPAVSASSCQRPGQPQQPTQGFTAYVSTWFYPLYQVDKIRIKPMPGMPGTQLVVIDTVQGGIVCGGEVPDPRPAEIFANGFDGASSGEQVFANGFEG